MGNAIQSEVKPENFHEIRHFKAALSADDRVNEIITTNFPKYQIEGEQQKKVDFPEDRYDDDMQSEEALIALDHLSYYSNILQF